MSCPRRAISALFASPPVLRSELIRQAYKSGAYSTIQRGLVNGAERGIYIGPGVVSGERGFGTFLNRPREATRGDPAGAIDGTVPLPVDVKVTATSLPSDQSDIPRPRGGRRFLLTTSLFLAFFSAGFAMAAAPVAETINGFVNPPTDAETLTLFKPTTPLAVEVNEHIISHPLAVKLRAQQKMVESRPHLKIPPAMRPHNLTGGTLMGEDKIEVPPLTFQDKESALPSLVQISYVGQALCGHPGIIHGGLLATMLDEGLARACFPALPNKVGVTASLKIDYRVPCPANSYVVLKAETTKVEGRKAWCKGWIELLSDDPEKEGTRLVESEALFIEPKGAASMARVYSSQ